jgi:hypothetical protein
MTLLPGDWPPALRAVIRGAAARAEAEARAAFYLAVLGAEAGGAGPEDLALAGLVMRASELMPAEQVARRLSSLRVEAASRLRAASANLRGCASAAARWTWRLPSLPGSSGWRCIGCGIAALTARPLPLREVFVVGDAVTTCPTPKARPRCWHRCGWVPSTGDPLPLAAGGHRGADGETPEDAARREAVEEAGLELGAGKGGEYYPTPGAVTEYLFLHRSL